MKFPFLFILFLCLTFLSPNAFAQEEESGKAGKVEANYLKDIQELAKNKQIQAAFQSIEGQNKQNLDELIMLTEIPSPPFKESKRAARLFTMLKEAGCRFRLD